MIVPIRFVRYLQDIGVGGKTAIIGIIAQALQLLNSRGIIKCTYRVQYFKE